MESTLKGINIEIFVFKIINDLKNIFRFFLAS
jgi:hypothetical protein